MADIQQEHQREMEGLLENVRQLSRDLRLQMMIIDNFIPTEYQVRGKIMDPNLLGLIVVEHKQIGWRGGYLKSTTSLQLSNSLNPVRVFYRMQP